MGGIFATNSSGVESPSYKLPTPYSLEILITGFGVHDDRELVMFAHYLGLLMHECSITS